MVLIVLVILLGVSRPPTLAASARSWGAAQPATKRTADATKAAPVRDHLNASGAGRVGGQESGSGEK